MERKHLIELVTGVNVVRPKPTGAWTLSTPHEERGQLTPPHWPHDGDSRTAELSIEQHR